MDVTVQITDDIATRLRAAGEDLPRRALEALAAEEYRKGHLHKPDLRRLLGFETSYEIDGFLKAHNIDDKYTLEEFERERAGAEESWIISAVGRRRHRPHQLPGSDWPYRAVAAPVRQS